MSISGMNHAVLYVRDSGKHRAFYEEVLGFINVVEAPGQYAFMRAPKSENHHDIAFFTIGSGAGPSESGRSTVGMYHLAWEVPTLRELLRMHERLVASGTLVGMSNHGVSKSLYAKDLDGLEHEILWAVPTELLDPERDAITNAPLDLDAEVARFGLDVAARVTA